MADNLLSQIADDLRQKSQEQFELKYTGWYLVGSPLDRDRNDISYKTDVISDGELRKLMARMRTAKAPATTTLFSSKPRPSVEFAFEIRKNPDNAFAGWITIGRAVNNDIVLRYPTVSKLHARLEIESTAFGEPLGYYLIDNRSTGKTVHNDRVLEENEKSPVSVGDTILFGNIRCTISDSTSLWQTLR